MGVTFALVTYIDEGVRKSENEKQVEQRWLYTSNKTTGTGNDEWVDERSTIGGLVRKGEDR